MAETLSGDYTGLLQWRGTWSLLWGSSQRWMKCVDLTLLSQSNFPWSLWPFCNRLVVETTKLICWLIGFQGIWDPCCYYVLLLRPQEPSLARSRKFQEHIQEWGGVLAPGMSLRLEVAACLLAACLWGQWPESIPLSWLCPWSMWIEALLVTMRFVRTQIRNSRI